jgi:hypothetical protein
VFYRAAKVSKRISYPLNGADRFQLYFDSIARKNTGTGNVIRAAITLEGIVSEEMIRKSIEENEWVRFLSTISLRKNSLSVLYKFESEPGSRQVHVTFHSGTLEEIMPHLVTKDCDLQTSTPMYVDVVYGTGKTHLIFSISHVLMDHYGMENLLSSFAGEKNLVAFSPPVNKKSLFKKFADAIPATMFVSRRSGRNMKRLKGNNSLAKATFELIEFSSEETIRIRSKMTGGMKTNALPFLLGCSLFSISKHSNLLTGKNYFVPVPMDRRPASCKNNLLSNFISFLYFSAKDADVESLENIIGAISTQMIFQARKNIPAKFTSLLDIFRFVPAAVYKAFIELPGNGHSATFAFSLLSGSKLERKEMMGHKVLDVMHYAPAISPPGLNVICSEFNGRLKVLCTFDERRIAKDNVVSYLDTLKLNLLG